MSFVLGDIELHFFSRSLRSFSFSWHSLRSFDASNSNPFALHEILLSSVLLVPLLKTSLKAAARDPVSAFFAYYLLIVRSIDCSMCSVRLSNGRAMNA